jgi:hypothetical protein
VEGCREVVPKKVVFGTFGGVKDWPGHPCKLDGECRLFVSVEMRRHPAVRYRGPGPVAWVRPWQKSLAKARKKKRVVRKLIHPVNRTSAALTSIRRERQHKVIRTLHMYPILQRAYCITD